MTAVNIFLQKERGVVMTDSLFTNFATEEPHGFMDKCFAAPGTKMAVAARGDWRVPKGIADELALYYGNIDQLIADEADAVRSVYDDFLRQNEGNINSSLVQIMIVGWSEEDDRPKGVLIVFDNGWSFSEIGSEGLAGPLLDNRELGRLNQLGVEPCEHWGLEDFDPVRHGIPYMEAQRRMKLALIGGSGKKIYVIGGHCLLTEVTREGVTQRVIREWPDTMNGIAPEPFQPPRAAVVAIVPGMSRQQRRRAERTGVRLAA